MDGTSATFDRKAPRHSSKTCDASIVVLSTAHRLRHRGAGDSLKVTGRPTGHVPDKSAVVSVQLDFWAGFNVQSWTSVCLVRGVTWFTRSDVIRPAWRLSGKTTRHRFENIWHLFQGATKSTSAHPTPFRGRCETLHSVFLSAGWACVSWPAYV